LLRMTDTHGLQAKKMSGIVYKPLQGFMLDDHDVDVNYIVVLHKPNR